MADSYFGPSAIWRMVLLIFVVQFACVASFPSQSEPLVRAALAPIALRERLGTHMLLEVFSAPFDRLNSSSHVLAAMHAAISAGSLSVVGELSHQFPVMGFSAVIMIRYIIIQHPHHTFTLTALRLTHSNPLPSSCTAAELTFPWCVQRIAPFYSHVAGKGLCSRRSLHVRGTCNPAVPPGRGAALRRHLVRLAVREW